MPQKSKSRKFFNDRKKLIAALLILVIAGATVMALFSKSSHNPSSTGNKSGANAQKFSPTQSNAKVNMGPATDAQKQDGQERKNETIQKSQNQSDSSTAKSQASVVIVEAGQTEVRGYVNGVLEDGGTCTAKATATNQQTVTATSTGFMNVSYTQCQPLNWPSPLTSGNWTITLAYNSSSTQASDSITKSLP